MKQVVFNEYNIRMEKSAYLPIASGLLRAFSETQDDIKTNYKFMPFNYHMDSMANIMALTAWSHTMAPGRTLAGAARRRWAAATLAVPQARTVPAHVVHACSLAPRSAARRA